MATNQLIIVNTHKRLTLVGQPYQSPPSANTCDVLSSNEHCSTYGTQHCLTTNYSTARTSVQRSPTAITLFPLSTDTTFSLEQCTTVSSSCHTFPLRRSVGFIYVTPRNTNISRHIRIHVLPVFPISPFDAPLDFTLPSLRRGNLYIVYMMIRFLRGRDWDRSF